MLHDLGSRDRSFIDAVGEIRRDLLKLASTSQEAGYEAIPMQGSGTSGLEAVVSSVLPPQGKLLVVINGAYGDRMAAIARVHGVETLELRCPEDETPDLGALERSLTEDPGIAAVATVHCETTTGIMNPVSSMGRLVAGHDKVFIVDSMSAFGAVEVDLDDWGVDYLVSSANKCIQGVPGFCFVICRRDALLASAGRARTVSLDLLAQWRGLEDNGQFRFTPPTHALLAFRQALRELEAEGGPVARGRRYAENHRLLVRGMKELGFTPYLSEQVQGPIITAFHYPDDPSFTFEGFYERLNERGFVIYPGKLTQARCFRIGTIGHLSPDDVRALLDAVGRTLSDMEIR